MRFVLGQDALFKVSKAYAVYDLEVGYCQGLSFVAASLLLHVSIPQRSSRVHYSKHCSTFPFILDARRGSILRTGLSNV